MSVVEKSVLVPYPATAMFDLVDAVESYPEFLPWCSGARVHTRTAEMTLATIDIGYLGIKQSFTTENRKRDSTFMEIHLREGPFRALYGYWRFTVLSETASKVELKLDYTFSNAIMEKIVGPVFHEIAATLITRFVKRAETLYAKK